MGTNYYKRDTRDVEFVLNEFLGIDRLLQFDAYRDFTAEEFAMILEQANQIAKKEIAPTFQEADREGARFENGKVYAPKDFQRLWEVFREGGWFALHRRQEFGGQGLPLIISEAVQEYFMSANFAFSCYAGMGAGNGIMIEKFGTQKLKELFVQKMYDGTWGACMCLTEADAGSDAHMITTKAIPDGDTYRIEGTKIFITSGEHDLTENIIHMVIARIEGAPEGAKGISLFAVPKVWVNDDGTLGEPNDVVCSGIEHKMGLNGSSTCVINYGENGKCRGWLIGKPGMGLAYMFDMVNIARMAVGMESVAFAANIYANVLEYAKNRTQGTLLGQKGGKRVRIIEHADVRRMLMRIKSLTEGMRALVYKTYFLEELASSSPDEDEKKKSGHRYELFTPLVKAYCSDRIFEIGRDAIQIMGGYGFCKEYPVEQYTRDCKILSIWDGTNYIQSADLVGRKLGLDSGAAFAEWLGEVRAFIGKNENGQGLKKELDILKGALGVVAQMSGRYGEYLKGGRFDLIALTSTQFLDCCAELAIGHLLLEQALIAEAKLRELGAEHHDSRFYRSKAGTARYYLKNFVPNIMGRKHIFDLEDTTAADIAEDDM